MEVVEVSRVIEQSKLPKKHMLVQITKSELLIKIKLIFPDSNIFIWLEDVSRCAPTARGLNKFGWRETSVFLLYACS